MIILGEEEVQQGVVKVKDMAKRTENVRLATIIYSDKTV